MLASAEEHARLVETARGEFPASTSTHTLGLLDVKSSETLVAAERL